MKALVPWFQDLKTEAHKTEWGPSRLFLQFASSTAAVMFTAWALIVGLTVWDLVVLWAALTFAAELLAFNVSVMAVVMIGWKESRERGFLSWQTHLSWSWPIGMALYDVKIVQICDAIPK